MTAWICLISVIGILIAAWFAVAMHRRPLRPAVAFWVEVTSIYTRLWFGLRAENASPVPAAGPVIVVANHTCAVDPLLLIACTPQRILSFLIAAEFANLPLFGRLTRMIGCIPIRRDGQDTAGTKAALRHLKAGHALGIFIEGRIPKPGERLPPKDGPALLALRTGATIVPARIAGTHYNASLTASFFRLHRARVRFGRPIRVAYPPGTRITRDDVRRLTARLAAELRAMGARGTGPMDPDAARSSSAV